MNVSELSANLYRQAGIDAAALRRLQSTRRTDRPESLGADRSDGPKFSEVLAALTQKHSTVQDSTTTESSVATEEESGKLSLSTTQMRDLLKDALSSDTISSDLVNALTDSSGEVSDSLLDMIFASNEEDNDVTDLLNSGDQDAALNTILTDAQVAQEYLSSTSGRNLIAAMAQRSLSSLIS